MKTIPTLHDAYQAHLRIKPLIAQTPVIASSDLAETSGARTVHLKLECLQKTGSFKIRGAINKISKLLEKERIAGVITASAGNHGQGVALAAKLFNIEAKIVVPEGTPIVKIEAIKNYSGTVIEFGRTYDESFQKALEIKDKENLTFIHAFNDLDIIKGQATIGFEILEFWLFTSSSDINSTCAAHPALRWDRAES